jgi:lysophospholipase L1-like esterase
MAEIFLFGDSITWGSWDQENGGWAQLLRAEVDRLQLARPTLWCPLYNLGIPGDTAKGIAQRFDNEICVRHEPAQDIVVVLAIGINDSLIRLPSGEACVTAEHFSQSLAQIHSAALRLKARLGVIGLTPINEELLNPLPWDPNLAYTFQRAELFEKTLSSFCGVREIPFVNLWDELLATPWKSLLYDGLHPNSEGHLFIYHRVRKLLLDTFAVCGSIET